MKKISFSILFILIVLLVGACGLIGQKDISRMDPKDLPNITAFQDEFTREFMTSTEQVEDGYYLFESKTGGYTMRYPEDASMNRSAYERTKDTFERFFFGEEKNEDNSNTPYYVIATYDHFHKGKDSSRLLNLLSKAVNYEGNYQEFEHEDNTIYTAKTKYTTKDNESTWFRYFGLIKSNNSNQSLEYIYSVECEKPSGDCAYDVEDEQKVKNIMKSVEFKDVELEEE